MDIGPLDLSCISSTLHISHLSDNSEFGEFHGWLHTDKGTWRIHFFIIYRRRTKRNKSMMLSEPHNNEST